MNDTWKNFLLENGAAYNDGQIRFRAADMPTGGQPENNTLICDLSQFSTVVIAGPDASEFIQGQFTNDVSLVDESNSQISAFCNNKGRMLANFRLFQYQQNLFISLNSDLVESSIEHLQNYVLRAQVALQDVSDQLIHIGLCGNDAESLLSAFFTELNTGIDSVSCNDDYIAIRVAGETPRYEIFCAADKAISLWQALSGKTLAVSSDYWELLNIENGLPFIDSQTSEQFVPLMANMDLINGVSFTKGCYTGQEIVARTHYLGKQKRRTFRLRIVSDKKPENGDQLATDSSTENQYTGTLVTTYQTADNEYQALAVIQITAAETERLKLKDAEAEITVLELPYSLEEKE